jgi:hypothetical protein
MAALALLALPGCSSLGDLGYVQQPAVADNIHAWVGQEAAARAGASISLANLTEDERTLRDLAFPLIEPAYDRDRWDAVVYEYGQKREFQRNLWIVDPSAYYRELLAADYRSTAGRYNRLNDDIRNDVVRIGPFFYIAHRVIEADRKRQATMALIPDVSPPERFNALARVSENNLTIAWWSSRWRSDARVTVLHSIVWRSPSLKIWRPMSTSRSRCCSSKSPPTNWSRPQRLACRRSPWPARRRPSCRPQWRPSRRRS